MKGVVVFWVAVCEFFKLLDRKSMGDSQHKDTQGDVINGLRVHVWLLPLI